MFMKRFLSGILLATSVLAAGDRLPHLFSTGAVAQTPSTDGLFYTYKGQRIPLSVREDAIAVSFKDVGRTRGGSTKPLFLQLQQVLQSGTRGGTATSVEVSPLGEDLAIVNLPRSRQSSSQTVTQQIEKQPYVQATLPVLSRGDRADLIVLPNEILVGFQPGLSDAQKQAILTSRQLELIRPLRFNRDRVLARSTVASGTAILTVANQLSQVKGVEFASPNFIQSLPDQTRDRAYRQAAMVSNALSRADLNDKTLNKRLLYAEGDRRGIAPQSALLGLQWNLYSPPLKQCRTLPSQLDSLKTCLVQKASASLTAAPRTDLHVTDAWKRSNSGRGVVVAVIDSLIQWDHPDLINNLYTVQSAHKCPGEVHGWDFTVERTVRTTDPCKIGDADTRISPAELAILKPIFQETFQLSDAALLRKYPDRVASIKAANPDKSPAQIARTLRYMIRTFSVASEFHGTWVSGVIAAQPHDGEGLAGVAPNAQILPVRAMGLNGRFVPSSYIEAIAYAADRGADVINISMGGRLPSQGEEAVIADVLKQHPALIIVASSGNEDQNRVSYPAALPGVVSVGATNLDGNRAPYSNYGSGLSVVAPGGDLSNELWGGIPTTGGTGLADFWRDLERPSGRWGPVLDAKGEYWWVEGTSFASPAIAGVVALMKGEDPHRRLTRDRLVGLLKSAASYDGLTVLDEEQVRYQSQVKRNQIPATVTAERYFFGSGLVNAENAVDRVQQAVGQGAK